MSRIFRSDAVSPGDRVVVRRTHNDVIGHVQRIDATGIAIRPQKVGGFVSSLPEVWIPTEDALIIKRLSPRTVRNRDIRAIELATAKAFPGIEHTWCGQWLLRAGDGITERSNSAAPLGPSAMFEPVPVDEIRAFYARHQLPARILIPERIAKPAEALAQDHELGPEIVVMLRQLDAITPVDLEGFEFRIDDQPDAEWLQMYHFRGKPLPAHALELLRTRIDGQMGFGRLVHEGETVAITRGTISDQYLGYSAVEVKEAFRRRGLGTALGQQMLAWGKAHGATQAYLQVIASNEAGIRLYRKLGFEEHHRHRYATLS
ncbi:N-acetylglutamate synthase, CG3035 family [Corynebacterium pelargi]|uniref:Putative acetyltransferase n=1 Tax=Corynebacterium pelargi TaxID=1471400 RepID=A0A410W6L9_9CORY|nr:GNAT family N-acetyltransferase [Corynebacterium pelargi]QAU51603.1 putative acetyltransferase [Corynebacterium pelargi]GGG79955.1 N-acetyltransferase [Corynebacterium pelargi]